MAFCKPTPSVSLCRGVSPALSHRAGTTCAGQASSPSATQEGGHPWGPQTSQASATQPGGSALPALPHSSREKKEETPPSQTQIFLVSYHRAKPNPSASCTPRATGI